MTPQKAKEKRGRKEGRDVHQASFGMMLLYLAHKVNRPPIEFEGRFFISFS